MDRSRVALIIPAYNEAGTIFDVVKSAMPFGSPIVVDDGSSDGTALIAEEAGAKVVLHTKNSGYDSALNSGFKEASDLGFEVIITLDADGQHNPMLLVRFIEKINEGADVVLGVRDKRPRIAEDIFAWCSQLKYDISDPLCGMKAYRINVYNSLGYFDSYQSIGTELMLSAVKSGFLMDEVNFNVRDRIDEPRFGRVWQANIKIIRSMFLGWRYYF